MKETKIKYTRKPLKEGNFLKKSWNFLWHGDSLLSWIAFLVVVFIFIKFIFFPIMTLITGSSLPIVIVESCSMHHSTGDFEKWWNENKEWYIDNGITKEEFENFPLKNGFSKGDIFFVTGIDKEEVEIGDTIIFASGDYDRPIIHRAVDLTPLSTKGDNNNGQFRGDNNSGRISEIDIKGEQIIGKATIARIPMLGWAKLIFYEPFRSDIDKGFCR